MRHRDEALVPSPTSLVALADAPPRAAQALFDQQALTHLSGMSTRCSRDMQVRRNIDAVVDQIRREIAEAYSKAAHECNEPLDPAD
jgi:hypothetical protein